LSYFTILHQLVDQQQFSSLKTNVEQYLNETGDIQALPLKALALAHLGERVELEAVLVELDEQRSALNITAQIDLAAVYCVLLQLDEALLLLEHALKQAPDQPLVLARLAWCRMQMGELSVARDLYQRSAELMPNRLPVWGALARLSLEANDHLAAQQALDAGIARLSEIHTEFPETVVEDFTAQFRHLQLELWVDKGELAEAEQWLEQRYENVDKELWLNLVLAYAHALASRDQHSEAEEALRNGLKKQPDEVSLISQLSELAQLQGRTPQAIHLLRRLIYLAKQQDKPEVMYWIRLSSACLHHREEQARTAAEKAITLVGEMQESEETPLGLIKQTTLQAKNALAQIESQEQNYTLAEQLFTEILTENPYFLPALQGLGQQQMQCGHIDEAIALFERIKQIDPAKGYSSLINVCRFPDDEDVLKRMEKAAYRPSMEGSVRAGLLLQIASAWEKKKQYGKTFSLAVDANAASKKLLHYDAKVHRQECARTRHAFCAELYQHRADCGVDSRLPVFVLGMPRSGTTLVEQILAGHSEIFGAGELGVIPSRIQGLRRWERHTGSGRQYPDCVDDLNATVVKGIAEEILEELQAFDPDAKHIVDKLPHNFENIGLIKFLFPNARIISVRRDPRDIAISNFFTDYQAKHGGMGFAYDLEWIGEQLADHNQLMHHWHELFPDEILEINYEEVVEDTEGMARKMLDYIGVSWEPEVLAFNELDRPVKTASVWQVRQPIFKTSKAKWKRYQSHLAPLIAGTNKKIQWDDIQMVSLPEAGMLTTGVALYREDKLDEAEYEFKKLLHHIPQHAAANFMLGIVYARKNHLQEAAEFMEIGHKACPWNKEWREDLIQAYEMLGETEKAEALKAKKPKHANKENENSQIEEQEAWATGLSFSGVAQD